MTLELSAEPVVFDAGRLSVHVPVNMDTAAVVLSAAAVHVRAGTCVLDLAAVPAVDSAALSVVLGLLRISRETGQHFSIVGAPAAFSSLAALYGVDELLSDYLLTPAHPAHA